MLAHLLPPIVHPTTVHPTMVLQALTGQVAPMDQADRLVRVDLMARVGRRLVAQAMATKVRGQKILLEDGSFFPTVFVVMSFTSHSRFSWPYIHGPQFSISIQLAFNGLKILYTFDFLSSCYQYSMLNTFFNA